MKNRILVIEQGMNYKLMIKEKNMKEYKNIKEHQHNKYSPKTYEAELWIDGKFIMNVTLDECTFRYNVLIEKLASLIDSDTLEEIEEVMQLKYDEGTWDGSDSIDR